MYDTRRDDRRFEASSATLLIHFRDDYEEDREIRIWRSSCGNYYWEHSNTHVMGGAPGRSVGWISEVKVHYELTMLGAGGVFVEHFPESWQARCQRRHGSITLDNLACQPEPFYEGAERVIDLPEAPYEEERTLYLTDVGLFIAVPKDLPSPEEGGAAELEEVFGVMLLEPGDALEEALRAGVSRELLNRYWPDELEGPLLTELGIESWAALEADDGRTKLLERCERLYGYLDNTQEREGSVVEEDLHRLDDARYIIVRKRRGAEGRQVELLRAADALIVAKSMEGAAENVLHRIFPDQELWRAAAEQLGQPL